MAVREEMAAVRVVSWNVGGCRVARADNSEDVDYFADTLRAVSADVVFLQEAHVFRDTQRPTHADVLADRLDYANAVAYAQSESHLDEEALASVAILSRHPLVDVQYTALPTPELTTERRGARWRLFSKGVLAARAVVDGTKVALVCGHAHPFHHFGRDALAPAFADVWSVLDRELASMARGPMVAGIDLNDERYAELLPRAADSDLRPVFRAPTTPQGVQQDYLLYSGSWFALVSWHVAPTLADHHLVGADLRLLSVAQVRDEGVRVTG